MEDPSGIQRTLTNKQVRKNAGDKNPSSAEAMAGNTWHK
jgi:hypothetical protein